MARPVITAICAVLLARGFLDGAPSVKDLSLLSPLRTLSAADLQHHTGRPGAHGWEADRRTHKAGAFLEGPFPALILSPGVYRATFRLRRGLYPGKGLLFRSQLAARLEVHDAATRRVIVSRDIDVSELPEPNRYEDRWVEFSIPDGPERLIAVAVTWPGGVNVEVESVSIGRFSLSPPAELSARANRLEERIRRNHLENGFVVSRWEDGRADETGDATTYTGYYSAALAWHLAVNRSDQTEQDLENAMQALHDAIKGDAEHPILARFVDADGVPYPASPSKDAYTAFFFACAAAYPQIRNEALRAQVRGDVRRIATRLLKDGLMVRGGDTMLVSLAPHFTAQDIRSGIRKLVADREKTKRFVRAIKSVSRFSAFQPLWPGMKQVLQALERRDEERLFRLALPTAEAVIVLAERGVRLLREIGRRDLIGPSLNRPTPPALRLANLLSASIRKLPPPVNGKRFRQPSDLRFLASNALIALHVVKTAAVITGDPHFEEYYRNNLFAQDALLQTALDWSGLDDELLRITAGNAGAASDRRGYLTLLSLYNLHQLEENPAVKETYRLLLAREAESGRHDDNPLLAAMVAACGAGEDNGAIAKALSMYPDSPEGFGSRYWKENGRKISEAYGGGENDGVSSEPLPVSVRPRDSFLWQRSVRRLKGDDEKAYPGADYVFLYWLARRHSLIAGPEAARPTAQAPER